MSISPFYISGFEHQIISPNGTGLFNGISGVPLIDTSFFHSGLASLKISPTGSSAVNVRKTLPANQQVLVLSGYIMLPTGGFPNQNTVFFGSISTTGSIFNGINLSTTGNIRAQAGSGATTVSSSVTMVPNQFYLIDLLINQAGTTWTVDWKIDGVTQTQVVATGQTQGNISNIRLGTITSSVIMTGHIDDVIGSVISADYPIGEHEVESLVPESDGTHNPGINVMEDQAGNDIGTAWSLIDDIPINVSTQYIRQVTIGSGNYVEILFGTLSNTNDNILGAMAVLAYTSSGTQTNSGGCIVSKDNFSTQSVLHGVSGSLADYSDGSTSDVYYKSVIIDGLDTLSEANSIKARLGYSGDVTPNPYWINMIVEVAYVPSESNDILLDLVTYSSTINNIVILENEIINLDLVSYVVSINNILITENQIILLDLISFSTNISDLIILENEITLLDLVIYSLVINDLFILENEIIILELVTYFVSIFDIILISNDFTDLDSIIYSSNIFNLTIIENEVIEFESISYYTTINDIDILEESVIFLELVSYLNSMNDIIILENELVNLDLVSYLFLINNIEIVENELLVLDLVEFSYSVNDVSLDLIDIMLITPIERCYIILKEDRIVNVESEERTFSIESEERIILIY